METKNVTEEEVRKSIQSGDGREFEIGDEEDKFEGIEGLKRKIKMETELEKENRMNGLKSKLWDLLNEYQNRGLDKDEINECIEFAQIHFEEKR